MRKSKLTPDTLTLRKLATAIGVKVQQLSKESKRAGFPRVKSGKKTLFRAADVVAWRSKNIRKRKEAKCGRSSEEDSDGSGSSSGGLEGGSLAKKDDPFILAMMSGDADALTINRAAMQMASRRVATAAVAGTLGAMDLDGLKKTLQELRAAEAGYIDLEKSKRTLLERSEVEAIVGAVCARLVRCVNLIENSIATEALLWISDEKMRAMTPDQKARVVRDFVSKTCHSVRALEASHVRNLIDVKADDDDQEDDDP